MHSPGRSGGIAKFLKNPRRAANARDMLVLKSSAGVRDVSDGSQSFDRVLQIEIVAA